MGIDADLFCANLFFFLYFYESQFITEIISINKIRARHFHSTERFIDRLCAINEDG